MILQVYNYTHRTPIIVIPKCGTRFVRMSDWDTIGEMDINPNSPKYSTYPIYPIHSDTIITYREPRSHIISAIQTDYVWGNGNGPDDSFVKKSYNLNKVVQNMIDDNSHHWSPYLYKNLYRVWNLNPFKLLHLNELSNLFDNKIPYSPTDYDSNGDAHYKSKNEIIKIIPKSKLKKLYELCDEDEKWLNRMLNNERGLAPYDDIVDLKQQLSELNTKFNDDMVDLKQQISELHSKLTNTTKFI
jgi:hypothetical protein